MFLQCSDHKAVVRSRRNPEVNGKHSLGISSSSQFVDYLFANFPRFLIKGYGVESFFCFFDVQVLFTPR